MTRCTRYLSVLAVLVLVASPVLADDGYAASMWQQIWNQLVAMISGDEGTGQFIPSGDTAEGTGQFIPSGDTAEGTGQFIPSGFRGPENSSLLEATGQFIPSG